MSYPCREEIERFQRAWNKLEELGINPRKLNRDMREAAVACTLTEEHVRAYLEFLAARYALRTCIYRHYVR